MLRGFARRHDEGPLVKGGSYFAAGLVGGMCHGNGCRKETTRLDALSCTKTEWSSLTHNQVLRHALARSLCESKVKLGVEDKLFFRERACGQNRKLNPLRIDITKQVGAYFDSRPRRKNKVLLLDIIILNPNASSNLENAERHKGEHLADAFERRNNMYRGSFLATYSRLPLAMLTCGEAGLYMHALIKSSPSDG